MLGSDVIYNEEAVDDLLATLNQLSGKHTTILLAGELRNVRLLFHVLCFILEWDRVTVSAGLTLGIHRQLQGPRGREHAT